MQIILFRAVQLGWDKREDEEMPRSDGYIRASVFITVQDLLLWRLDSIVLYSTRSASFIT